MTPRATRTGLRLSADVPIARMPVAPPCRERVPRLRAEDLFGPELEGESQTVRVGERSSHATGGRRTASPRAADDVGVKVHSTAGVCTCGGDGHLGTSALKRRRRSRAKRAFQTPGCRHCGFLEAANGVAANGATMFGVVFDVRVIPGREDEARAMLEAVIVPRAKAHPGFLSGQWLRALEGDALRVVHRFDTEEHARGDSHEDRVRRPARRRAGGPAGGRDLRADRPGVTRREPAARLFKEALVDDGIACTSFAVDDVAAEHERLVARRVRFPQPIRPPTRPPGPGPP